MKPAAAGANGWRVLMPGWIAPGHCFDRRAATAPVTFTGGNDLAVALAGIEPMSRAAPVLR